MATADTNVQVQLDLFDRLQNGANDACRRLTVMCESGDPKTLELKQKFHTAVADIEAVTIQALAKTAGAFVVDGGTLRVSEEPVSKLLAVIVNDIESGLDEARPSIDESEIPELLERVFVQYVLHELRHRTQGLANYQDVAKLKAIAGDTAMAEYDAFADRDAAMALAHLYAEDKSRAAFLRSFREALFFSTTYFFEVFPVPATRPDKIARAMAILFMAARLSNRDLSEPVDERKELPLDAALHVSLSTPQRKLAIHLGEPSRQLLGSANDEDGVGQLIDEICVGDFSAAMETSIRIMDRLDLLG